MVYFLAAMPSSAYEIYCSIVHMIEKDPKKLSTSSNIKSDCKGFHFKGLRGLDPDCVLKVLQKVKDGSLKFNQLNNYCKKIKALDKVKLSFIKQVGAENWESAMLKYPAFASEQKLLDLFVPNFNPESMSFMDYCRRAVM